MSDNNKKDDTWLGGHGARLTQYQKKRIREFCVKRDGLKCMLCKRKVKDLKELQIDHIDGQSHMHWSSNLQLAHQSCNARAYHKNKFLKDPLSSYTQREKGMMTPHNRAIAPPSYEVGLNLEYEPLFRKKCFEFTKDYWLNPKKYEEIDLSKNVMRVMAREIVGCCISASYSYIERLFAPLIGPLVYELDTLTGKYYVGFRDNKDLNLTLEQIEKKYPKTGQREREEEEST